MKAQTIFFTIICLWIPALLFAQDNTEKKKAINEIKSNNAYIYADEYGDTPEEALELADIMLEAKVARIIVKEKIAQPQQEKMKDNLRNTVHIIELTVEDMFRVCKYISRSELFSADVEQETSAVEATASDSGTALSEEIETVDVSEKPPIMETTSPKQQSITTLEPSAVTTEQHMSRVADASAKHTGNALLNKILTLTTVDQLKPFLDNEKNEKGTLMFGTLNSLSNNENAFLIVFSRTGAVEAVLGKGKTIRHNYLTGNQSDSLSNYPDKNVVWVLFYEPFDE
jgi:hypothetical protein